MNNEQIKNMLKTVKDENFEGWEDVPQISENELFNVANETTATPQSQPSQSLPPSQPQQATPQATTTSTTTTTVTGNNITVGALLDPELAVELMDVVGSTLCALGARFATKKKVPRTQFKATAKEKELLVPTMAATLASMNIRVTNPAEALLIGFITVYGSKVALMAIDNIMDGSDTVDSESDDLSAPKKGRGRPKKTQQL